MALREDMIHLAASTENEQLKGALLDILESHQRTAGERVAGANIRDLWNGAWNQFQDIAEDVAQRLTRALDKALTRSSSVVFGEIDSEVDLDFRKGRALVYLDFFVSGEYGPQDVKRGLSELGIGKNLVQKATVTPSRTGSKDVKIVLSLPFGML